LPTPAIGGVGLMRDVSKMATVAFKREGDVVILIGETKGHLGQSIYLREVEGREEGGAPAVDTVHDLSDGGLLVAIAEMALAGNIGASIGQAEIAGAIPFWFGEDQARYL